MSHEDVLPRQALAAITMLRRTGLTTFQLRFQDDEKPVVRIAAGEWPAGWVAAGDLDPKQAIYDLCDKVIDGGQCTYCGMPTMFDEDPFSASPFDALVCSRRYDPETDAYRRQCEGQEPPTVAPPSVDSRP